MKYSSANMAALLLACVFFQGCSTGKQATVSAHSTPAPSAPAIALGRNERFQHIAAAKTRKDKDMAAILAMQGEHAVSFNFNETVVLKDEYKKAEPKSSGAFEVVMAIENTANKIVLQHLLTTGEGHVIKHWRQDWIYEATERFEFVTDQTWELMPIDKDRVKGYWTQCVYEVSDAPRYCGTGRWHHKYGVSTWTSDRTWRPLPRREYTVRDDYNALNVENRHTVTPGGWTHEQDNTKVVRKGKKTDHTIVREFGFNEYLRINHYDFSPVYAYWDKTHNYWKSVRAAWDAQFERNNKVAINTPVDGMPIIVETFKQANYFLDPEEGKPKPTRRDIDAVLTTWVSTVYEPGI